MAGVLRAEQEHPVGPRGPAWVLGASGLLGSAVVRRLRAAGREVVTTAVPWTDPAAAVEALVQAAAALPADLAETYWCAGAGVVGSSEEQLRDEVAVLEELLRRWESPRRHSLFLASSAGGVYAGSTGAPFTEAALPVPLAEYGRAKLRSEEVARAFAERTGSTLLVGRLSNLYGPGQDIAKPQGLISQLCRAQLTRQPLSVYVSLDTMRDYLFVEDGADMVVTGLGAVSARGGTHLKILASEHSTTIGAVLGELRRVTRHRPPVVLGSSPNARFQVHDLRLRSLVWPPLSGLGRTTLAAGISSTLAAVRVQLLPSGPHRVG